jgi:radical SAM protein with 4Fe4S-binding SPASM domain
MGKHRRFYINVWDGCNLNCSHCFNEGGKTAGKLLSPSEIEQLIAEAQDSLGIEEVQLTGGEPTQRPDIFPIMRGLLKRNLKILLQTNGVFGSDITDEILRLPGDMVSLIISLDGIETNDYFRGKYAAQKVFDNIEMLYKKFQIRLNILLSDRIKWEEIEALALAAQKFNLTLAFNPICPEGRADVSLLMPPVEYFQMMCRLEELRNKGIKIRKCFNLKGGQLFENENCPVRAGNTIHIAADGSTCPCGFLVNNPVCYIGTARDSSLIELMTRIPGDCKTLSSECRECEFYKNGYCHGGCPARIYGLYKRFDAVDIYCMAKYFKERRENE